MSDSGNQEYQIGHFTYERQDHQIFDPSIMPSPSPFTSSRRCSPEDQPSNRVYDPRDKSEALHFMPSTITSSEDDQCDGDCCIEHSRKCKNAE